MSIVSTLMRSFDTCDELLDNILHDYLWEMRAWKFRGQGHKDHMLVPSALRENVLFPQGTPRAESNRAQIIREWGIIKLFAHYADQQGLLVPGFGQDFRELRKIHSLVEQCANGKARWPPSEIHGIMALAQHYGIPTRIIDWSRAPLVALYFAARYAAEEKERAPEKSQITLYALNEEISRLYVNALHAHEEHFASLESTLKAIDVPYAGNPNITAQRGTFTCVVDRQVSPEESVCTRDVEQIVAQLADSVNALGDSELELGIHGTPLLVKLAAPGNDAGRLLRKLNRFGVKGASLFPGYFGASRSVMDRTLWDATLSDEFWARDLASITSLPVVRGSLG